MRKVRTKKRKFNVSEKTHIYSALDLKFRKKGEIYQKKKKRKKRKILPDY